MRRGEAFYRYTIIFSILFILSGCNILQSEGDEEDTAGSAVQFVAPTAPAAQESPAPAQVTVAPSDTPSPTQPTRTIPSNLPIAGAASPPGGEFTIWLKSREFEPSPGIERQLVEVVRQAGADDRIHVLLQLDHIPEEDDFAFFRSSGIELLDYVPDFAWFATVPANVLSNQAVISQVRWMGEIQPSDRLSPQMDRYLRNQSEDAVVPLQVLPFSDVPLQSLEQLVLRLGGRVDGPGEATDFFSVSVPKQSVGRLAQADIIQWISPPSPPKTGFNDGSREAANIDIVQEDGLSGTGVDLGIWDGGLVDAAHPDFIGRVIAGETVDIDDHATHVAGTMAGNGSQSAIAGGTDLQWRGVAFNANIVSYDFDGLLFVEHQTAINTYNIALSNNSWGSNLRDFGLCSLYGVYDDSGLSRDFDKIVRGEAGKALTVVFAAGNDQDPICPNANWPFGSVVGPGGTAKNTVVVGATNSDDDTMTDFSSWGPTVDGRIKPDVVAPGGQTGNAGIVSTMPQALVTDDLANGVCPLAPGPDGIDDFFFPYTNSLGPDGQPPACEDLWEGTSMAAPVVSGIAALLIEQHRKSFPGSDDPLPSTIKALLIHGAEDVGNSGPDYQFGYGRVDAERSVNLIKDEKFVSEAIINGEVKEISVNVSVANPLKVTLVWDDLAIKPNMAKTLINDLELTLTDPGGVDYNPWVLDKDSPANAATRGVDNLNNVEQVTVTTADATAGIWKIRVRGDKVLGSQNFSLVFDGFDPLPMNPRLVIAPPESEITKGGTTTTEVQVQDVVNLAGVDFILRFDPNIVNVLNVDPTLGLFNGSNSMVIRNDINADSVDLSVKLNPGTPAINGGGTVAVVTWQGNSPGLSALSLKNVVLFDNMGNPINHTVENGKISVLPKLPPGATIGDCYRVQVGETLYSLAKKFGIDPHFISVANDLYPPHHIFPQQILFIPEKYGYGPNIYVTKLNDTLNSIGAKCKLPVDFLAQVNKLDDIDPEKPLPVNSVLIMPIPPFPPPARFQYPSLYSHK